MQELGALEAELGAAVQAGQADAFVSYLYGLVLSDRCAPAPPSPASALSARLAEHAMHGVIRVAAKLPAVALRELCTNSSAACLVCKKRVCHWQGGALRPKACR